MHKEHRNSRKEGSGIGGINWPGTNLAQSFSRVARGAPSRIKTDRTITIKDVIADAMLQQALRPREYGVLATMNLNGDYISDALAATGRRNRYCARRQHKL